MGGSKRKSPSQQEKSQTSEAAKKEGKKSKKGDKKEGGPKKAEITVMLNDDQAMNIIKGAKVLTAQDLARQTGVKISAANTFLIRSLEKGIVKRISGRSGHYIYQPVSA